jgi:bla regulator protein BlaR1
MTGLSQLAFLQALGWATLNSIWQMALLWCCVSGANYFFKLSAAKKYFFSVVAILGGACWFISTFVLYYNGYFSYSIGFSQPTEAVTSLLPPILTAASITYLLLLTVPAYRLFQNWKKVQFLRKNGLQKVEVRYKLFVKKIAAYLGIKKNVGIYFSELVKSPLTVGYFKPLILLPLASINNLTVQQVEAVLLHELSHIRRFDYLVNILISIAHTFLYFNPFTRLLIKTVQEERENCCDQMVLQFGYDKVSYASALLSLEKTSLQSHVFVLGAAGKRNLLSRIEKIIGVEKKLSFGLNHFMGLAAALLCIFVFNSLLITSREKNTHAISFNGLANPFYFFDEAENPGSERLAKSSRIAAHSEIKQQEGFSSNAENIVSFMPEAFEPAPPPPPSDFIQVAYNEAQTNLSKEQTEHIKATIENTKKLLSTYEWKEVEKTIGDAMSTQEKAAIKQEYLNQVNKIDWENMEKGLKAAYENINWKEIDGTLKSVLATVKLDSLQTSCEQTLEAIEKVQDKTADVSGVSVLPFPDESLDNIKKQKERVETRLKEIRIIKSKKVVKL